jgi:sugar lactone lactonase YvrE
VSELTAGVPRQGINFAPASAAFNRPIALALDASNNVWVANSSGVCAHGASCGSLSKLPASNRDAALNFAPAAAAIVQPNSVAVDSNGNLWVSNGGPSVCVAAPCGSVSELAAANPNIGALNFVPPGAAFVHPTLLALDASGNVWVSQFAGVSELIGLAGPVLTPIQACLKTGKAVCRP